MKGRSILNSNKKLSESEENRDECLENKKDYDTVVERIKGSIAWDREIGERKCCRRKLR